jgi:hypothetical protein
MPRHDRSRYNTAMATVTISDHVAASASARAAAEGFASLEQYVEALLLAEAQEKVTAPDHLSVRSHEQVVALVREGLASTPRELRRGEVDRKRDELAHATESNRYVDGDAHRPGCRSPGRR